MKRALSYSLALVLALCAFSAPPAHAQTPVCKIYGTVDSVAGPLPTFPAAKGSITVTRARRTGSLFSNTSRIIPINPDGTFSFYAPRTSGTDTAVIHVTASFGNLAAGQYLYVPDADSAELRTLVRYTANPQLVVVAVPTSVDDSTQTIFDPSGTQKIPASRLDVGAITGDTTGTTNQPAFGRFENALGQFTAGTSDSLLQAASNAVVARNVAEGKAGADSVHTVLVALSNLIAGKGSADSIHTSLVTLYNLVAGKPGADSVHSAIDAMLRKADTNAVHAQKFALINDSLLSVSLRATATKNDLTAHIGTADAHLPSQSGNTGKFLKTDGSVSSWADVPNPDLSPYALKADSVKSVGTNRNMDTVRGTKVHLDTLKVQRIKTTATSFPYGSFYIEMNNGVVIQYGASTVARFYTDNANIFGYYFSDYGGYGENSYRTFSGGNDQRNLGRESEKWRHLYLSRTGYFYGNLMVKDSSVVVDKGNVVVPNGTVSAKGVIVDSLVFRMAKRDTTVFKTDSLSYWYESVRPPSAGMWGNVACPERIGWLTIGVSLNGLNYTAREMTLVADTANGVRIINISAQAVAYMSSMYGGGLTQMIPCALPEAGIGWTAGQNFSANSRGPILRYYQYPHSNGYAKIPMQVLPVNSTSDRVILFFFVMIQSTAITTPQTSFLVRAITGLAP